MKTESINRVKHNLEFQKTMIVLHNKKHRKHIKPQYKMKNEASMSEIIHLLYVMCFINYISHVISDIIYIEHGLSKNQVQL